MTQANDASKATRRQFLSRGGSIAAGAALLGSSVPAVHAAE
ncbi:MAG: twin-arginine translocation signal domain-containing protein, partial [Planctomycetes bacterium]|nr:twin-arginine translocation signal domain-containing protein [Planctomycetota bacterium]